MQRTSLDIIKQHKTRLKKEAMAALRTTTYLKDQIKLISRQKEEAQNQLDKLELKQAELAQFQQGLELIKQGMLQERRLEVENVDKLLNSNPTEFTE